MTKKFCDKCGKEIEDIERYPIASILIMRAPTRAITHVDLCHECTAELFGFLESYDKRRTSDDETLQKAD